jgi:hypothetical protein
MSFSAWHRAPVPAPVPSAAVANNATVPAALTPEEMDRRIQATVVKAVADVEARYAEKNRVQLAEFQKVSEDARNRLLLMASGYDTAQRRAQTKRLLGMNKAGDESGDPK